MSSPRSNSRRARWAVRGAILTGLVTTGVVLGASGCMERLFYYPTPGRTNPPPQLPATESVWFEASDGVRLHGWFIRAEGGQPSAPTILHVHGNAGNIESHVGFTEYLPPAGFNLFIFDYRGYGQSEGSARRRGPLIGDSHAALDTLLGRPDIDTSRIALYGQSLGGSIALNLLADRPEIRAAVIESAFASWREIAANTVGGDSPGPLSRMVAWLFINDAHRPLDAIRGVDVPVLILHGTADTLVPISHGRRLAQAGPHAELIELAGGEHNTLHMTHPEVETLTIEFFHKHLSGRVEHGITGDRRQASD